MSGTKTNKTGYWKVRGHVFGSDTYVCSCCGRESGSSGSICPSCGASMSGSLNGICTNRNSIGIEVCSSTFDGKMAEANDKNFYFTDMVLDKTVELTGHLMRKYNIPVSNVVRHYDVTGKFCPGIIGWNEESGSEANWNAFKARLTSDTVLCLTTSNETDSSLSDDDV